MTHRYFNKIKLALVGTAFAAALALGVPGASASNCDLTDLWGDFTSTTNVSLSGPFAILNATVVDVNTNLSASGGSAAFSNTTDAMSFSALGRTHYYVPDTSISGNTWWVVASVTNCSSLMFYLTNCCP